VITLPSVRGTRRLLAPLDPARRPYPQTDSARQDELLLAILSAPRAEEPAVAPVAARPGRTRRLVLAAVAASLVVLSGVAVMESRAEPAFAATPPMLRYETPRTAVDVPALLRRIAASAAKSPAPGSGAYEYLRERSWSLGNEPYDPARGLQVTHVDRQVWLRPADCSGRVVVDAEGEGPSGTSDHGPGELTWPWGCPQPDAPESGRGRIAVGPLPATAGDLRDTLAPQGTFTVTMAGKASTLGRLTTPLLDRVLPAATRAALCEALAQLPGVRYAGTVTDRAGRRGEAFFMTADGGFGPVRETVIIDPASGAILGFERILDKLTNPRYLNDKVMGGVDLRIKTPAVVDYRSLVAAEHRAEIG
jgi:hypothetical protein